ncbi:MAG: ECF transporter S component [Clostridium chrysemydis]|uniref:ECF transporter S component n=1 Tax=Clostridium chrysemydis TaxID=2665504 RepID=UPI003F3D8C51
MKNKNLNKTIKISLLAAIAFILMFFELPLTPFPWLKLDLSDVPALMGAFTFGPLTGILIEFLKVMMNLLLSGTSTGGIGELANFLIGASFIAPAAFIYFRNKSKKTAIIGMIVGGISINIVGILANAYLLLPAYGMHLSGSELINYIMVGLVPINTIKAVVVSVMTYILYKRVSVSIFKVEPNFGSYKKKNKDAINVN